MKSCLLDVNLLVALAWPSHVHHERAHRWFANAARHGWATCPTTQSGLVRVSSNPAAVGETVMPRQAIELLRRLIAVRGHEFWPEDRPFSETIVGGGTALLGHKQVTDAYLVGLAQRHGGRLATLDGRIAALVPSEADRTELLEIVAN